MVFLLYGEDINSVVLFLWSKVINSYVQKGVRLKCACSSSCLVSYSFMERLLQDLMKPRWFFLPHQYWKTQKTITLPLLF